MARRRENENCGAVMLNVEEFVLVNNPTVYRNVTKNTLPPGTIRPTRLGFKK